MKSLIYALVDMLLMVVWVCLVAVAGLACLGFGMGIVLVVAVAIGLWVACHWARCLFERIACFVMRRPRPKRRHHSF